MTPARLHRFSSASGITIDLHWRQPHTTVWDRLRSLARRVLIGGPDPYSPAAAVAQDEFDRAVGLFADGIPGAAARAFDRLGYDCRVGVAA
ncbi:hypothetical protein [Sinomonas sp. G460-2]|uniref:hypothetical protein n=1 Tax=Sinomonas sp. G460-2 TaxID=3393464 RepID=UPI0039EE2A3A